MEKVGRRFPFRTLSTSCEAEFEVGLMHGFDSPVGVSW